MELKLSETYTCISFRFTPTLEYFLFNIHVYLNMNLKFHKNGMI